MTQGIPASQLVSVTPAVVGAGGSDFELNGLFLTTSYRVPIGTVASFPGFDEVEAFFGPSAPETLIAEVYFQGFTNATQLPGALLFAQYPWQAPVPAYLQSGPVSSLTLAQLQAISGVLTVTIDGETFTSSTINLAAATSFSSAATIIQTALAAIDATVTGAIAPAVGITAGTSTIALNVMTVVTMSSGVIVPGGVVTGTGVTAGTTVVAQLTGTPGGAGTYQVSIAQTVAATALTVTNANAGVLTVSAVATGTVVVGDTVAGTGVTAGTYITAAISGTGGTGSYVVSASQTVSSTSMNLGAAQVTYDSQSGSFFIFGGALGVNGTITFGSGSIAAPLNFTQANGAVISQGAAVATPNAAMTAVINVTPNWFTFGTVFDPVTSDKVAFAEWCAAQGDSYLFLNDSGNIALTTSNYSSVSWGIIQNLGIDGTLPIYDPNIASDSKQLAAAASGFFASLDFNRTNGRQTLAYRNSPGATPSVYNGNYAAQLVANKVNFYGYYSSPGGTFIWWQFGNVSGKWGFADSYANAVWLKNNLQNALLNLLGQVGNIPYNPQGYGLIESAMLDPVNAALNYGAIRSGVQLSAAQIAEVNNAAGLAIDQTLFSRGWYIQIVPAPATVRGVRGSPETTLWYTDGESVQKLNVSSQAIV